MEWTREQRYRLLDDVSKNELKELQEKVDSCKWRQSFHIQPRTGLLNDPNGFSFYNGEYHLFYQWFPLGPIHGIKYWYHLKSTDLVDWEDAGIGITPNDYYDRHGAFSGSAIEHEGKLHLVYTGNTRDENWVRHPYQCMAIMDEDEVISKLKKPVIEEVPYGYTDHFRDPKVWKEGDRFFAVIGAQRIDQTGCIVLYSSPDLRNWKFEGEVATDLNPFGYMWECPDYFVLDDNGVLVFSPQGLKPIGDQYNNIYQSGYIIGEKLDLKTKKFEHGSFNELDRGFDFYAPQTTVARNGRRILVGWMGLPEIDYPTDVNGWAHCLTLPRELSIQKGKIIQKPVKELEALRGKEDRIQATICNESMMDEQFTGTTFEMICEFSRVDAAEFGIELRVGKEEKTVLTYSAEERKVILDRTESGEAFGTSYGTVRKCELSAEKVKFHLFVDVSSVEIFVNDGIEVFTSRIFPRESSNGIRFFAKAGSARVEAVKWSYDRKLPQEV